MCLTESGAMHSYLDSHELTEGCEHPYHLAPTGSRHYQVFPFPKREMANIKIAREGAR